MLEKVLWQEGMMLLPHHFQQQERYFEHQCFSRQSLHHFTSSGIIDLELEHHDLEQGWITLKKCKAILPNGLLIDFPNKDVTIPSLKMESCQMNEVVYVGIPAKEKTYTTHEIEVKDDYSTPNDPQTAFINTAALSIQLVLKSELAHCVSLPILQINKIEPNGEICLNEEFIPPVFNIYHVSILKTLLKKLENKLHYQVETILKRLNQNLLSQISKIEEMQLFTLYNRYEGFLKFYNQIEFLTLEILSLNLFVFAKELAAIKDPKSILDFDFNFDQSNYRETILPLIKKIESYFGKLSDENITPLPIEKIDNSLWQMTASSQLFNKQNQIIIGINSKLDNSSLIRHIKISPSEMINDLIYRSLPGIDIQPLPLIPRGIPYKPHFSYFLLNQKHALWKQSENASGLSIFLSGTHDETDIEVWSCPINSLL